MLYITKQMYITALSTIGHVIFLFLITAAKG